MAASEVGATLEYLKKCREARAVGYPVAFATDPAWLVDMAINRRAGWPDDPTHSRGSARPLPDGRYPPKAEGDTFRHLRLISFEINTPRLIVRPARLGEWRKLLERRIPHRLRTED